MAGKVTKGQLYQHMQSQHGPRNSVLDSLNRRDLFTAHEAEHGAGGPLSDAYGESVGLRPRDVGHEHESYPSTKLGKVIPGTGLSGGPMSGQDVGDNRATNTAHPANRERNKELARRKSPAEMEALLDESAPVGERLADAPPRSGPKTQPSDYR